MNAQLTTYATLVCTSAVLNLVLGLYVYNKRHEYANTAKFFVLSTAATTIYCFGYAFSLTSTTLEQLKIWNMIQYIGMPFAPPLGLLFVMAYLGMKITRRRVAALLVIPVLSFLLDATNDLHHLHYRSYELHPTLGAPYSEIEVGIWFMVHGIYLFVCMLTSILLLLARWKETTKSYRPQLITLLCGQFIPMVTAFLYLVDLTPTGIDPVPMVVWISSLLFVWAMLSSRMLTIVPVAKDTIFNGMNDGVLVLDDAHRLIDYNQACTSMFEKLDKSMLSQHLDQVWVTLSGESLLFDPTTADVMQELTVFNNGSQRVYQVRSSRLQHPHKNRAGLLLIFTDITELKRMHAKLEYLAYYDELTQIYNRRAFFEQCEQYFATAIKENKPFTIILFDIDHFKRINDTYGHQVGDQMLVHVVQVCKEQLQEGMILARYGGEEFVLALSGYAVGDSQALANHIRVCMETKPLIQAHMVIPVTSSFGVAEASETSKETLHHLLGKADESLYAAKREGRNRVCVHNNM